jgi:signal transduction histidine kinase
MPNVLANGGLRAGVATLASRVNLPVAIDVTAQRFPSRIESTAYFIVSEALTNVVKHASASAAAITARADHGQLIVEVSDDGVGGAIETGNGLTGLADRASALDGRLVVASPRGQGTSVRAFLPTTEPLESRHA